MTDQDCINAAYADDAEQVKKLFENGYVPEKSIIKYCVLKNAVKIVKLILKQFPKVKLSTLFKKEDTDLSQLAIYKDTTMIKLLVQHKVNVTRGNIIPSAAYFLNKPLIEFLIQQGTNVNVQDKATGRTALYSASYNGDEKLCEMLLKAGADTEIKAKNGKTPLMIAYFPAIKQLISDFIIEKSKKTNMVKSRFTNFLKDHGLQQYEQDLIDAGYEDMETIALAKERHFVKLDMKQGHILKLLKAIKLYTI